MVSFIIIGKNEGQKLVNCIKSVKEFTDKEKVGKYEIIYVDSQSTDDSVSYAINQGIDKVFVIDGKCNAAIARNIGAKEAVGDILFFLDGDMELLPGFWKKIVNERGKMIYPVVSGIENDVLYNNDWDYIITRYRRKFKPGKDRYTSTLGGLLCINRGLWRIVGGFDPRLNMNEDLDYGVLLANKGFKLCRKPDLWVNHHTRFYGLRAESEHGIKYTAVFIRKHLFNLPAQIHLLPSTYSYWLLPVCIALAFFVPWWMPLSFYLAVVIYRMARVIHKTDIGVNPFKVFIIRLKKDFKFWWYFLTYWPRKPAVEYSRSVTD